jgi:hypothetical protein
VNRTALGALRTGEYDEIEYGGLPVTPHILDLLRRSQWSSGSLSE